MVAGEKRVHMGREKSSSWDAVGGSCGVEVRLGGHVVLGFLIFL